MKGTLAPVEHQTSLSKAYKSDLALSTSVNVNRFRIFRNVVEQFVKKLYLLKLNPGEKLRISLLGSGCSTVVEHAL